MEYFSTFSGIGGFELGIQRAYERMCIEKQRKGKRAGDEEGLDSERINFCTDGLTCIGFSEVDKYATQVYEKQFPQHKNYGDITKINAETLPDFDTFVGGFPCQAFSIAGKRKGFDDTRGTLFFDIARILREKQPRLLVLENVKGLLSHNQGSTFVTITTTLDELGYDVEWQVLNSKDFGVPQNRERVFIIGHLRGSGGGQIFPIGQSENQVEKSGGVSEDANERELSRTLFARDYKDPKLVSAPKIRRLTPKECERLQGFPDDWTKYGAEGEISDTQRYKMCGNAVTVNVVESVFNQLLK